MKIKQNWESVIQYLQFSQKEHVVLIDGITYAYDGYNICEVVYETYADGRIETYLLPSNIEFNTFIKICDSISDEEIVEILCSIAITKTRKH